MKNGKSVWNILTVYRINSIFVKYFILVFITFVIPLSSISVAVYFYIESNNDKQIKYAYEQSLLKISDTLDMIFNDVAKLSVRLSMDNEIIAFLSNDSKYYNYELKALIDSVSTKINLPANQYINSIYLYSRANNYILSSSGFYSPVSHFNDRGWLKSYMKLESGTGNLVQFRAAAGVNAAVASDSYITSLQVVPVNSHNNFGVVIINVDVKKFDQFISGGCSNNAEDIYIIDSGNTVIYNKNTEYIGCTTDKIPFLNRVVSNTGLSDVIQIDGKRKLAVNTGSKSTGYSYVSLVSIDDESKAASLRNTFIIFLASGFIFSVFLAFVISLNAYRPFRDIISIINTPDEGNGSRQMTMGRGFNELKYIISIISGFSLKKMNMERELYNNLAMLKKSQTIALQAQINPHFLYNTLNEIKWMVTEYTNGENEASEAITTLSQLLRLSLETKENLIHLGTEIEHAKKYIIIEKLRFEDLFDVIWDIPVEIMDFMIVKITLQPIIENAIYHGIKQKKGGGIIAVRAEMTENAIIIEVEDNGVGIDTDELEQINKELQMEDIREDNNIGLKNVNLRIKLIFGEAYGVQLYSERNKGTIVKIVIPKVK